MIKKIYNRLFKKRSPTQYRGDFWKRDVFEVFNADTLGPTEAALDKLFWTWDKRFALWLGNLRSRFRAWRFSLRICKVCDKSLKNHQKKK